MNATRLSEMNAYSSPWLKPADLRGQSVSVTIEKVTVEPIRQRDGSSEDRIVVAFVGKSKRLILNKTQALTIADIGRTEEFGRWVGLAIGLRPGTTRQGQDTIFIVSPRGFQGEASPALVEEA